MLLSAAGLAYQDINNIYFQKEVVPIIFKYEGTRFVNDPKDPGGPTKFGWTLATYRKLINPKATKYDIKFMDSHAAAFYYQHYFWDKYGAYKISNRKLAISLVLAQINLGPYRPNKMLQRMANHYCHANLNEDGILGNKSIAIINKCKYLWPGYPYILYYFYSTNPKIAPVWKWAHKGIKKRLFHGVNHA